MNDSALTTLAVAALVVGVLALLLSILALRGQAARRRRSRDSPLPTDLAGLREEVERLRGEAAGALRRLAVVRYDAFGDMGGRLSWSLALCDDEGDGVVITSISGRSDARTYAKNVAGWACDQPLSPEEEEAVTQAKASG
ncbi:DUF4446 family protein [Nocardioides caldifontis]|uniref:DUF4446 family protein n=1 Tax=Nocardioides caldifontis TaxID=2588938 RepID=UPI0011E000E5|nr:DUF4446 family protein [Nocardioides caldifontis]